MSEHADVAQCAGFHPGQPGGPPLQGDLHTVFQVVLKKNKDKIFLKIKTVIDPHVRDRICWMGIMLYHRSTQLQVSSYLRKQMFTKK